MALRPYDPVGAMGGLFAPAMIRGNRESELAFDEWMARNLKRPPAPDAPPAPPAPTMEGAAPESAEEAAARQRDAIAKTIMMLQGGEGGGVDTTAPLDPNLDPNPHTGPESLSASPTPPAIDRDNTPPVGTPPSAPPVTATPVTATPTPAPPTDNRGVTVSHREGDPEPDPDAFGRALENMQLTPLQDPNQQSIIDQQAPPAPPPAPAPVAAPPPPAAPQDPNAPQTTPVPGMPMNPDIVPVSTEVQNPFGPVPGPNTPVPSTPLSTLAPHVGPPPPAMDNLNTLTTPWGRGNPWGLEHTPQQAPPNPFTPINTMMETILGTPNAPNPSNPFGENPYGGGNPYGGTPGEMTAAPGLGYGGGGFEATPGGGFDPGSGYSADSPYGGGYGGTNSSGFGPDANAAVDAAVAGTATGYQGGTVGSVDSPYGGNQGAVDMALGGYQGGGGWGDAPAGPSGIDTSAAAVDAAVDAMGGDAMGGFGGMGGWG